MRGYAMVVLGIALAIVGGAADLWMLDVGAMWLGCCGAIMIERDATREVDRLARWTSQRSLDGRE